MLEQLKDNLMRQCGIYREILSVTQCMQRAIVENDAATLSKQLDAAQPLMRAAQELELQRAGWLANAFPNAADTSLSSLCATLPRQDADALQQQADALRMLILELQYTNDLNKELLETHFQHVERLIDTASHQAQPSNVYGARGYADDTGAESIGLLNSQI